MLEAGSRQSSTDEIKITREMLEARLAEFRVCYHQGCRATRSVALPSPDIRSSS